MKKEKSNYQWVFWISISFRKWFKLFSKNRGANFLDIQILWFVISIGRPWIKCYVDSSVRDYGSSKHIHKSNKENLKHWFSLKITPALKKEKFIPESGVGHIGSE